MAGLRPATRSFETLRCTYCTLYYDVAELRADWPLSTAELCIAPTTGVSANTSFRIHTVRVGVFYFEYTITAPVDTATRRRHTHLGVRKPGDTSGVQDSPPLGRRSLCRAREATHRPSHFPGRVVCGSALSKLDKIPGHRENTDEKAGAYDTHSLPRGALRPIRRRASRGKAPEITCLRMVKETTWESQLCCSVLG